MIKAIAFDLWETVITNTSDASRAHERLRLEQMEQILADRGFAATAERIHRAYGRVWYRCQELYWSVDQDIPCRTQIDHFLEELELERTTLDEATLAALEEAYAMAAVEILPSIIGGAQEVLSELKQRGYLLGLISNTGRTPGYALRTVLERLGLAQFFDAMVFSDEHGECKPRRSIFENLRLALHVSFDEMLFVGDNLYVDVHGAQRCGMIGVHFQPPERGTAVAPPVPHDLTIEPEATIRDLPELIEVIDGLSASPPSEAAQTRRS